ncbi:MAG: mucoidy inhibitor MuiA family protein, partial [Planctomycetota bacterium]|nr:mucoidy inhibitor MuiA family protein [Planctomycetota bacterium]
LNELSTEYERLSDELKRLANEIEACDAEIEFARGFAKAAATTTPSETAKRKVELQELRDMVSFVRETIQNATAERLKLEQNQREIQRKIDVVQSQMNELSRQRSTMSKSVLVTLVAEAAMKVKCSVTYLVPAASWAPAYDVRYLSEANRVELVYYSVVVQRTGEDWNNVMLELSTATPTTSVSMPDFQPVVVYPRGTSVVGEIPAARPEPWESRMKKNFGNKEQQQEEKDEAEWSGFLRAGGAITAGVTQHLTSVSFKNPKPETIPCDGRPHKSVITIEQFAAKLEYVTTPSLSEFVYLRTSLTNTSSYPILPGEMSTYVGASFIGKAEMKAVAPNETFQLYFGSDKDLKVERKVVQMQEEGPTMFRSSRKLSKSFKITLQNFKNQEVTVSVIDSIPVSWTELVKVTMVECKPKVTEQDEMGKLTWVVKLAAKGKEEISFKYDIEHPQSHALNLENWSIQRLQEQQRQMKK